MGAWRAVVHGVVKSWTPLSDNDNSKKGQRALHVCNSLDHGAAPASWCLYWAVCAGFLFFPTVFLTVLRSVGLEFVVQFRERLECFKSLIESHRAFCFSWKTVLFKLITSICNIIIIYIIPLYFNLFSRTFRSPLSFLSRSGELLIDCECGLRAGM